MNNDRVMPIRRLPAKMAVGLFWAESWLLWPLFLRYRLQICFAHSYIKIDRRTKLEVNRTQNGHFSLQKDENVARFLI